MHQSGALLGGYVGSGDNDERTLVGEVGTVRVVLAPGHMGKIELRGASFSARNISTVTLQPGERCRVATVDGLTVNVAPEGAH